jgi:hypothetical protein
LPPGAAPDAACATHRTRLRTSVLSQRLGGAKPSQGRPASTRLPGRVRLRLGTYTQRVRGRGRGAVPARPAAGAGPDRGGPGRRRCPPRHDRSRPRQSCGRQVYLSRTQRYRARFWLIKHDELPEPRSATVAALTTAIETDFMTTRRVSRQISSLTGASNLGSGGSGPNPGWPTRARPSPACAPPRCRTLVPTVGTASCCPCRCHTHPRGGWPLTCVSSWFMQLLPCQCGRDRVPLPP